MGFSDPAQIATAAGSAHRIRDLCGEAMAAPCVGGVLACLLANILQDVWEVGT